MVSLEHRSGKNLRNRDHANEEENLREKLLMILE
jgi:hypothetical protein